jgi:hypothetical protein
VVILTHLILASSAVLISGTVAFHASLGDHPSQPVAIPKRCSKYASSDSGSLTPACAFLARHFPLDSSRQ